jgi:hypothetical protein
MGSSGTAGGGSGQWNNVIDGTKLKREVEMRRGNDWACGVTDCHT